MTPLRVVGVALLAGGTAALASGLYLPAKAAVAQVLLRDAWARTVDRPVRPWPWADTWPVARLRVPRLGVDRIVLAGVEGAALAFGPGHVDGTAAPGEDGNVVVAGHRDTSFRFLAQLRPGDAVWLEGADRRPTRYEVATTAVAHERDIFWFEPTDRPTLTLVTCYPVDATRPGGPLRYVVSANSPSGR